MSHRKMKREDFVGKTIRDVDVRADNVLRFKFGDGTTLALEAETTTNGAAYICVCDHCGEFCEELPELERTTSVDDIALREAIHFWLNTAAASDADGRDLYLRIVAEATQLSYAEVLGRYKKGDPGIHAARKKTKQAIFRRLLMNPASILVVHNETLIQENPR